MRSDSGPFGEPEGGDAQTRRLTPSPTAPRDSDGPEAGANEDFLFHLYRGSELLQDNRAHEAKEELERALHLQPHDTKGQDLLAVVYFRLGLYARAITIYEQLRRTSPRDPALLLNLALCYLKTGQPALARRDLEQLLAVNPSHTRAWGYLGLACERLGDLVQAQRAFDRGGHAQMARRMAERRASASPPPMAPASGPSLEVREAVATAYEELDAGDLSFELAHPTSSSGERAPNSWKSVELGQVRATPETRESQKPDTRDGPPPALASSTPPRSGDRRPTLMVGVPPPHELQGEIEALSRMPSPRPPSFDEGGARRPAVVVPGIGKTVAVDPLLTSARSNTRTLPPPEKPASAPAPKVPSAPAPSAPVPSAPAPVPSSGSPQQAPPARSAPPPPASQLTRDSHAEFPKPGSVVVHAAGVALVHTAPGTNGPGFAARLEAIRASSNALAMKLLERHINGRSTGESFGGVGSPVVHAAGEGQLVLAPRPGRKLSSFILEEELCFVREDVLLGFDGALAFENGRLATGDGESIAIVQLRGRGAVLMEAIGEILTLDVAANRGLSVRREVVLGWFGRLVPRALPASEAPCGQRGLVSFLGEGRVLVASA